MATTAPPPETSSRIPRLLGRLRSGIRTYVWLEGIAVLVALCGLIFWLALAIDYLPVLIGFDESSRLVRLAMLIGGGLAIAYVFYRFILRRAFVPLRDRSMAVVLERRFTEFGDSLLTSVEMEEHPDHAVEYSPEMLGHARVDADAQAGRVRLSDVFNFRPLALAAFLGAAFAAAIVLFAVLAPPAFGLWIDRFFLLSDTPWPRSAHVEVIGLELVLSEESESIPFAHSQLVPFEEKHAKVARGSSVRLWVHADAEMEQPPPEVCTIYYRTAEGERGRVNMQRLGRSKMIDGHSVQEYSYDGKPFKAILSTVTFDVRGRDHRVRGFELEVVDTPAVVKTELDTVYPAYMVDQKNGLWLPRSLELTTNTHVPRGTHVHVRCESSKPLQAIYLDNQSEQEEARPEIHPSVYSEVLVKTGEGSPVAATISLPAAVINDGGAVYYRALEIQEPVLLESAETGEPLKIALGEAGLVIGEGESVSPAGLKVNIKLPSGAYRVLGTQSGEDASKKEEAVLQGRLMPFLEYRPGFEFDVSAGTQTGLMENLLLEVSLLDADNVLSEKPHRILVAAVQDEPPRVQIGLSGIGTAVTPEVRIPIEGTVQDDYAVAKSWFNAATPSAGDVEYPVTLGSGGKVSAALDFRDIKSQPMGQKLVVGEKLELSIMAADKHNLEGGANIGAGDKYNLDIVTADQLRSILEARELGLRRRFEQIIVEMTETRDSLLRLKNGEEPAAAPGDAGAEPEDALKPGGEPEDALNPAAGENQQVIDDLGRRYLRVEQSLAQAKKSELEVLGVATQFDSIRLELINNRVDAEDHKKRIKELIADPLREIAVTMFPELEKRLDTLQKELEKPSGPAAATAVVEQTDAILFKLDEVLTQLLKLENYNELIELVRGLIADQERLIEATKQERKKQALEDLLD